MAEQSDIEKTTTEAIYCGLTPNGKRKRIKIFGEELNYKPRTWANMPVGCHFYCDAQRIDGITTIWFYSVEPITGEDGEFVITNNKTWTVDNLAGKKARTMTAAINKVKREQDEDIFNLTVNELKDRMWRMKGTQRASIIAHVLQRLS